MLFIHYLSKVADWQSKVHNSKVYQQENFFKSLITGISYPGCLAIFKGALSRYLATL